MLFASDSPASPSDTADETPAPPPVPKRRGTLLIVDDEDGPRQSLRVIFKDDYEIMSCSEKMKFQFFLQNSEVKPENLKIYIT